MGEMSTSTTWSSSFEFERQSSSTESYISEETSFSSVTFELPLPIPANKKVTRSFKEMWGKAEVSWSGVAICLDKRGIEVERQMMNGTFKTSKYLNIQVD